MAKMGKRSDPGSLSTSAPISASGRTEKVAVGDIATLVAELPESGSGQLCLRWRTHLGGTAPAHLPRWLLARVLAYRLQAAANGDLVRTTLRRLRPQSVGIEKIPPFSAREPATRDGASLRPGALLVREWKGQMQRVMVLDKGFAWNGATFTSLSQVAKAITGTNWNGHRFFGLRKSGDAN